ncbi:nuclear transport factor 2 family protein [Nocardia sp. NPDC127526]|uniref:nuclear transport factor 2 family protein n=1 Tax=Nocardia sp. NPDC127526 TaxID=3345393 RepID=UPI00363F78AC
MTYNRKRLGLIAGSSVLMLAGTMAVLFGSSSGPQDEKEIDTVLREVLAAPDPFVVIDHYSTELRERYENNPLDAVRQADRGIVTHIENIVITGDLANAEVTIEWNDGYEATDIFFLRREDGRWRYLH